MVCIMISWHTVFRQLPRAKKRQDVWQHCSITDNSLDINKWLLFLFVALCCPLFRLPKKSELQGYEPSVICFPIVKLSPKCWTLGLTYLLLGNKHIYSKSLFYVVLQLVLNCNVFFSLDLIQPISKLSQRYGGGLEKGELPPSSSPLESLLTG